jgi:hypothetical protein
MVAILEINYISVMQLILSGVLGYLTYQLANSTKEYAKQVQEQTILMDKQTRLHEYENKKDDLIRKRDRLVKEIDNLIGPLSSVQDSKEYFEFSVLSTRDRYEYIAPPQAGRDFIFNKRGYEVLNFWEKIQHNSYLCQDEDLAKSLNTFFEVYNKLKTNNIDENFFKGWLPGINGEIKYKTRFRYSTLTKEITKTENELEALTSNFSVALDTPKKNEAKKKRW